MRARLIFDSADNSTTVELIPENDGERNIMSQFEGKNPTVSVADNNQRGTYRRIEKLLIVSKSTPTSE